MSNEYYRYFVIVMLIAIFPGDHAYAQNQKKDCVCRTDGEDKTFQLPPTTDCLADCKGQGATNVQICQLLTKTTKGDCKGNIACVCGINVMLLGEGVGARFIMKNNYNKQTVEVGETVKFVIQGLPMQQRGMSNSCVIKFGDGEKADCVVAATPPLTHKYARPGVYLATVEVNSAFRHNGADYSCEYTCSSGITEAPIKVVAKKELRQN